MENFYRNLDLFANSPEAGLVKSAKSYQKGRISPMGESG